MKHGLKTIKKRGVIPWRPFACSVRQRHRFRGRAHTGAQWPGGQPSVDIGYSLWTNDPLRSILGKLSTTGTSQFTLENYHFCGWFAYYYYQRVRISGLFYASSAGSSLDSSKEKTSSGTKNQAPLRAKMFFPGKPETHSLRWWRLMIHCPKVTCKKHQMKQQMFEELLINWPVPSI